MASLQLQINGVACDLKGDETLGITLSAFSLENIERRSGTVSVEYALPRTTTNALIFQNSDVMNSVSSAPYKTLDARLYENGVDTGIRYALLMSSENNYTVRLFGENSGVFIALKGKKLNELKWPEKDHWRNLRDIDAAQPNWRGDVYTYPVICTHKDPPNTHWSYTNDQVTAHYLRPAVFDDDILKKMFSDIGYTVDNDMDNDPDYKPNPVTTLSGTSGWKRDSDASRYTGAKWMWHEIDPAYNPITDHGVPFNDYLFFQKAPHWNDTMVTETRYFKSVLKNQTWMQDGRIPMGTYTFAGFTPEGSLVFPDKCKVTIRHTLRIVNNTAGNIVFHIRCNGTNYNYTLVPGVNSFTMDMAAETITDPIVKWETVYFYYWCDGATDNDCSITGGYCFTEIMTCKVVTPGDVRKDEEVIWREADIDISGIPDQYAHVNNLNYVTIGSALPDMTQAEWLKAYCNMWCLNVDFDDANKIVKLSKFDNIVYRTNGCLDWSDKMDRTDPPVIEYRLNGYSAKNTLKWKSYQIDSEDVVVPGANYTFESDSSDPSESVLIEQPFAASPAITIVNGELMALVELYKDNGATELSVTPRKVLIRKQNSGHNIQFLIEFESTYGWSLTSMTDSNRNVGYFIDTTQQQSLGYKYLAPKYFKLIASIVSSPRVLRDKVRLNPKDIQSIDQSKPVWIDEFNSYFFLQKVSGYIAGANKSTLVEFIKLLI